MTLHLISQYVFSLVFFLIFPISEILHYKYVVSVFVFSFGSIFLYFYPILFTCLVFLTMLLRFVYVQRKKAIMQMRIVNFYRTINFSQTQDKSEWWIRCRHYYDAIPMCGMFVLQQNFNFI